jgi:hypothetical protein
MLLGEKVIRRYFSALALLGGLALPVFAGIRARAAIDGEALNAQTVKITVRHGHGVETGAGVIFCHAHDQAYILTAQHVLYGTPAQPLREVSAIEIEFYKGRWPAVKGARASFKVNRAARKDLAVLQIPLKAGSVSKAALGASAGLKTLQEVYTTGHPVSVQKDWLLDKGVVKRVGEFILYSANISRGYSGGPVVNEAGELIGINTEVETSPEGGTVAAQAIPIDEVVSTITPWVASACIQRPPPEESKSSPVTAKSLLEITQEYGELRDNDVADLSAYRRWYAKAEAAVATAYAGTKVKQSFDQIGEVLKAVQNEGELRFALWEIDIIFENFANEMDVETTQPPSGGAGSSVMDRIVGNYALSGYQDLTGARLAPPLVQGTMQILKSAPMQGSIAIQIQTPIYYLNQTIVGYFDGANFSGSVTNSNAYVNIGTAWMTAISFTGNMMTMTFPNGEFWYWTKQ